jgi:hypothetical protein
LVPTLWGNFWKGGYDIVVDNFSKYGYLSHDCYSLPKLTLTMKSIRTRLKNRIASDMDQSGSRRSRFRIWKWMAYYSGLRLMVRGNSAHLEGLAADAHALRPKMCRTEERRLGSSRVLADRFGVRVCLVEPG